MWYSLQISDSPQVSIIIIEQSYLQVQTIGDIPLVKVKGACKYYISMLGGSGGLKKMFILLMWFWGAGGL